MSLSFGMWILVLLIFINPPDLIVEYTYYTAPCLLGRLSSLLKFGSSQSRRRISHNMVLIIPLENLNVSLGIRLQVMKYSFKYSFQYSRGLIRLFLTLGSS